MYRYTKRTIVLMRHGQSDYNAKGMIQDPIIPSLLHLECIKLKITKEKLDKLILSLTL